PFVHLQILLIYILILYLENQVTNVNSIPNNQCPENESFSNENTNLTSGIADLNGPAVDISNSSILIYCKGCKKNCSSDLFHDPIRNKSFKRCNDCRRRDYDRRHPENFQALPNPRPQQSIALPHNPQSVATINTAIDNAYIYCRKCRNNCPPEFFTNPVSNFPHATCLDCRTLDHTRRFPTVFEPIPNQGPSDYIEDIDDVNEEEVNQLAANIGMFEIVEEEVFNGPVPEEAPLGDDPVFMLSQIQSREFRIHDEIQRRLQADEEVDGKIPKKIRSCYIELIIKKGLITQ
ncbi:hypothetical protein HI914_04078, partial [Erysiphe necator]